MEYASPVASPHPPLDINADLLAEEIPDIHIALDDTSLDDDIYDLKEFTFSYTDSFASSCMDFDQANSCSEYYADAASSVEVDSCSEDGSDGASFADIDSSSEEFDIHATSSVQADISSEDDAAVASSVEGGSSSEEDSSFDWNPSQQCEHTAMKPDDQHGNDKSRDDVEFLDDLFDIADGDDGKFKNFADLRSVLGLARM